jgi:hypothetical protein
MNSGDPCPICFALGHHSSRVPRCGNKYNTIEACEAHQRNRSHYSGHFLLADVARTVRLPSRYDDGAPDANAAEAENGDAAAAELFDAELDAGLDLTRSGASVVSITYTSDIRDEKAQSIEHGLMTICNFETLLSFGLKNTANKLSIYSVSKSIGR